MQTTQRKGRLGITNDNDRFSDEAKEKNENASSSAGPQCRFSRGFAMRRTYIRNSPGLRASNHVLLFTTAGADRR